ncbi:Allantoate permease [Pleurostoma richardsiae]|uniref:Allantoate permease n=1 Tax=Pleurostoma richardsiae TaxID=41990 RepID=A0AA38S3T1_9PEZI|nr:Allantoate permease [Pleurostoma richardsiae]
MSTDDVINEPASSTEKNASAIDTEAQDLKRPKDADVALDFLNHEAAGTMTEVDEKKLVRKIDWRIVPLMWMCYNLQYLDKTLINYANVMGLQQDTNISGNQFSQLALVFYVTYLAFELPTGYLMQRLPTAKYLGANVTLWGLMVTLTCAAKNWAALVSLRVLLGCFESAVAPALILLTTMWYKKSEQPPRMGFWYVGTGTGSIIGSIASFGFQHYTGKEFTSWQIMFLVFGLITIATGITVMLVMPDNPMKSSLTHDEKIWAIERLRENKTGIENKHFKPYQMLECFRDPQTWLISIITIASNVPNGAVSSFQATIIKGFGYTSKETALLSIPSGVVAVISVLSATWLAGRFNQRGPFVIMYCLIGGVLGGCLLAFSPAENRAAKLAGNYLTNCVGASLPLMYSYSGANYAGHTKKVTMNAVLLMSFCLGNIIGPLTFRDEDKPDYIPAKITIVVTTAFACVMTGVLMMYYAWENRRRDRNMEGVEHQENSEFFDLTDKENPEFRYRW